VPSFCRHNRFIQNCPICREPEAPPRGTPAKRASSSSSSSSSATRSRSSSSTRSSGGVRVRRVARAQEDGYASPLVPGLRATADAVQLADEIAFATGRLAELADAPPGLYAEAASAPDRDEAAWLAAQVVLLGPDEETDDPFAGLRDVVVPWAGGGVPDPQPLAERARAARAARGGSVAGGAISGLGPRSPYGDTAAARRGLASLRSWAERQGGLAGALAGDPAWTPERRFERLFERLGTVSGIGRARYDLLVVLGQLGVADVRATSLHAGDRDDATQAAKRVFGIGDRYLLDRRASELAEAAEAPMAALDLALANLDRPPAAPRITVGASADAADPAARERAASALGV
jgi:hypothetical protein